MMMMMMMMMHHFLSETPQALPQGRGPKFTQSNILRAFIPAIIATGTENFFVVDVRLKRTGLWFSRRFFHATWAQSFYDFRFHDTSKEGDRSPC
jgi:hypothetical protein